MWKRFGTPVHDADSGTEHEFKIAYSAYLASDDDKPQILFYFKEVTESKLTKKERGQYRKVQKFRNDFPEEGLYCAFKGEADFERYLYDHLGDHVKVLLRKHRGLAPQPVATQETTKVDSSVTSDSYSQPVDDRELGEPPARPLIHRTFLPFVMPWKGIFAATVLLIMVFGLYSLFLKSRSDTQYAGVIEKDIDAGSAVVTLSLRAPERGKVTTAEPASIS